MNLRSSSWSKSFFSDLGVHTVVSYTSFYLLLCLSSIFSFLKCVFPNASPAWLTGSALSNGGTSQNWLCPAWRSCCPLLTEAILQPSTASTLLWTPNTPQGSLSLIVELPPLSKDFGLIFDPTENYMHHFYTFKNASCRIFERTFRTRIFQDLFKKNLHLDDNKKSLSSLCTSNILSVINVIKCTMSSKHISQLLF